VRERLREEKGKKGRSGEGKRKGKEEGREGGDLPDQCQTASYAPGTTNSGE